MLEINNRTRQKINLKKTTQIVEKFLEFYKKSGRVVSLAIVGDAKIKRLSEKYRGINKITDVLSFSGEGNRKNSGKPEGGPDKYLGEIIINLREANRTGKYQEMFKELGINPGRKSAANYVFYFLLVHGLLHLIGYDDKTARARRRMLVKGKEFLSKILLG